MRTLSVLCVLLVIAGLGWAVYAGIIRPTTKPNPSTATSQKADAITNNYINPNTQEIVNAVKENKESAFEANLFPPRIKIGGLKLSIWDK